MNAPWWQEDLERMRREQNPGKYNPTQPTLQLPIPTSSPLDKDPRQSDTDEDDEPQRGVYVIDM